MHFVTPVFGGSTTLMLILLQIAVYVLSGLSLYRIGRSKVVAEILKMWREELDNPKQSVEYIARLEVYNDIITKLTDRKEK